MIFVTVGSISLFVGAIIALNVIGLLQNIGFYFEPILITLIFLLSGAILFLITTIKMDQIFNPKKKQ
ncbi:MAG: hypothetical protein ACTSUV_03595 [Candidatus Ranarchaeia archaeon]